MHEQVLWSHHTSLCVVGPQSSHKVSGKVDVILEQVQGWVQPEVF